MEWKSSMIQTNKDVSACSRQPRRTASMAEMSIFFIVIIASKARSASPPTAASAPEKGLEQLTRGIVNAYRSGSKAEMISILRWRRSSEAALQQFPSACGGASARAFV
jgi:hypothetical protein